MEKFNLKYLPNPRGLPNTGVICYFNSLLQCLLSCSALNNFVINTSENSMVLDSYKKFVNAYFGGFSNENISLLNVLLKYLNSKNKHISFGKGQEDANECFNLLVDSFECRKLEMLFEHRYRVYTFCDECSFTSEGYTDEQLVIDLSTVEIKGDINEYIYNQEIICEDYKCTKCGSKKRKIQKRKLTMVSEVLVVLLKKYQQKSLVEMPNNLKFGSFRYELVAVSEHSGSMNGGHYWAKAMRAKGAFNLNDSSVSTDALKPTQNTYLLFYHLL